ncbi:hypothetical protein HAX54_006029, partial [Datura stramonium]|nr:hypothetical protein [Datura stramonium]
SNSGNTNNSGGNQGQSHNPLRKRSVNLLAFVYFKTTLVDFLNSWWLNSGETFHVTNNLQDL